MRLCLLLPLASLLLPSCVARPSADLAPTPEESLVECSDLADNDQDGFADCADPACGRFERCSDGASPDQDPDGLAPDDDGVGVEPPPDEPGAPAEQPDPPAGTEPDDGTEHACDPEECAAAGGTHCCNGACINYYIDLDNCGACGAECRGGVCGASFCLCGGASPDMCGTYDAPGHLCTSFLADPANCGGCGNVCPVGQGCCEGTCGSC